MRKTMGTVMDSLIEGPLTIAGVVLGLFAGGFAAVATAYSLHQVYASDGMNE